MRRTKIGRWNLDHSGISFQIPVRVPIFPTAEATEAAHGNDSCDNGGPATTMMMKSTVLNYHAEIHLNRFGERPRMCRGVVTRDRYVQTSFLPPQLFRPVVTTFTAEGVGKDTLDTTYKERGFGLLK